MIMMRGSGSLSTTSSAHARVLLRVSAVLVLSAAALVDAFSTPVHISRETMYHVNTTVTPVRCGETVVAGKAAFISYVLHSWTNWAPGSIEARIRTKYLRKGTCASAGYDVPWDGPIDVKAHQVFRSNTTKAEKGLRYHYDIKFFRKPSREELLAQGEAASVYHINPDVQPPRCGQTIVLNKNLDGTLKWLSSPTATLSYGSYAGAKPLDAVPLKLGTCAEAGYGRPAPAPEDVSSTLTIRYSIYSYGPYDIKFFHKGGKAVDKSVLGLAATNPKLSTFGAALQAAGLRGALAGPGHSALTIFAPTNAAFKALGPALATLLEPQNKALLAKVLEYHVVRGALQSYYFTQDLQLATLEGQQLSFSVSGKDGALQVNGAAIVGADIRAADDIVHVVDKVLLYPGFSLPTHTPAGATSDDGSLEGQ